MGQKAGEPANGSRQILKVAPGEGGKYWEECLAGGFICVGWDEVGDLRQYGSREDFRNAFRTAYLDLYKGHKPAVSKKANDLWRFRDLRPGDRIVANRGTSEILGVGTVVEPGYVWRPDRREFKHTVRVQWDTSVAKPIPPQRRWAMRTVDIVDDELFRLIMNGSGAPPAPEGLKPIMEVLRRQGLFFSPEVISNYLLALQAKRFVILTGISGTGKTRLAMEVARHYQPTVEVARPTSVPEGAVEIEVQPYMLKYNRTILPVALLAHIELPSPDPQTGGVFVTVRYAGTEMPLRVSTMGTGNTQGLLFKGEFRKWFAAKFQVGDRFFLRPYIDGETPVDGLEVIVPKTTARREALPNYRVVAVRPDWTDNRGLLGYYNPITESYVTTEFLRLLLDARADELRAGEEERPPFPFFAILDEMNLARVEHYFSDFLSALESGEEIELHHNEAVEAGEVGDGVPIPRRLRVPRNVFFTGTVNVDETTYMFSPKVLDRAFTIEFNDVDLSAFGSDPANANGTDPGLRLTRLPRTLQQHGKPGTADWDAFGELRDGELRRVVIELNELLEGATRHFGYRVASEIGRFVCLADEQADSDAESLWAALDLAILQKVLPKFHGTQQELEETLGDLLAFAVLGPGGWTAEQRSTAAVGWRLRRGPLVRQQGGDTANTPRLPRTAAKVWRMLDRLRKQGFTAYVE